VTGYTDPEMAEKGTVRGDLGIDSITKSTEEGRAVENLVHASGNPSEAETELRLWFP
jgi:nucleoside-diphosphate kinase